MQFDNCVSVIADILVVNFSVRFAPKADIPEHGRHLAAQRSCPLYPPKADMCSALADVRFVPIADIRRPPRMVLHKGTPTTCSR